MAVIYTQQQNAPKYTGDDEGFVADILTGLKSIPHLPAALLEGWDNPSLSPEERKMRQRSVSEAAMWVIPALVTGGAGALLKGAGPLVMGIVDAAGVGAGSAISASVKGEDPVQAGLMGAALGGAIGAGVGYARKGAAAATEAAAREAERKIAVQAMADLQVEALAENAARSRASRINARVGRNVAATEGTDVVLGGARLVNEPRVARQAGDLFDYGMAPNKGVPNEAVPVGGQLGLFGESPSVGGARSSVAEQAGVPVAQTGKQELYSVGRLAAREDLPGIIETTDRYTPAPTGQMELFDNLAGVPKGKTLSLFNEVPPGLPGESAPASTTAKAVKSAPKTLEQQVDAVEHGGFSKPIATTSIGSDAAQVFNGQTPNVANTVAIKRPRKVRKVKVAAETPATFAPDEVLESSIVNVGKALERGHVLKNDGSLIVLGRKIAAEVNQSAIFQQGMEVLRRAARPGRKLLASMGAGGAALASKIDDTFEAWRLTAGKDIGEVRDILLPFTAKERMHIGGIMEGLELPASTRYSDAAEKLGAVMERYASEAEQLGVREILPDGGVVPFRRMANYFPHYYDERTIKKYTTPGSAEFEQLALRLQKIAAARDPKEAQRLARRVFELPSEFRTGPINFARQLHLPGYERDPMHALSKYIYDVRRRLEITRSFGHDHKGVLPYIEQIMADGGNGKLAQQLFRAFAAPGLPNDYAALTRATSTYNILTMLSTAGIVQPAQLLNVAARTNISALMQGIGAAMKREGREWAHTTGGHLDEVLKDMLGVDVSQPTEFFLKYMIGLEPLDKANRIIAALSGRFHAEQLAEKWSVVKSAQARERIAAQIEKLGLKASDLEAQGGKWTNDQLRIAGFKVSTNTQFASQVMDLPEFKNHALGKVLYQFKPFALQQTEFINNEILAPARAYITSGGRRGSLGPLMRYSAGVGPVGAAIGQLVRGIKGRVPSEDPTFRTIENLALAGGLGIYYDIWSAMAAGPERIMSFLAGPSAGELTAYLGEGFIATTKGDPQRLTRHILRRIPLIGQPLVNVWLPKE